MLALRNTLTPRRKKIGEAQLLAGALLDAEARLGELLKAIPIQGNTLTSTGGRKASLPEGITPKQSHYFQTLADNVRRRRRQKKR